MTKIAFNKKRELLEVNARKIECPKLNVLNLLLDQAQMMMMKIKMHSIA